MADHFSKQAATYARHRPTYPPALFSWLGDLASAHDCAWDCATGNGQAAVALAAHFTKVIATDTSAEQIAQAFTHPRVAYSVATAEHSRLADASVDLISVAQAYHWFDQPRFLEEAQRILLPQGILAIWGYNLLHISPAIDALIREFYDHVVGPYWPSERRHVEDGYQNLPFPTSGITAPDFAMAAEWTLEHLCGYLRSWSATQRYANVHGHDPVVGITAALTSSWQEAQKHRGQELLAVSWPLFIRVSRRCP